MTDKQITRGFLSYLVIFIITFGFSYNLDYEEPKPMMLSTNTGRALFCGMFWPFYWVEFSTRGLRPSPTSVPAEQP